MNAKLGCILLSAVFISCNAKNAAETSKPGQERLSGTWRLVTGRLVEKGNTTVTDYTQNTSFIKIINETHFAFLQHGLKGSKDSAVFAAGGGRYSLNNNSYTEHLEYCNAREWEGHDFTFTVSITNDTLVQKGIEKVEGAGIERLNTEVYVRMKEQ